MNPYGQVRGEVSEQAAMIVRELLGTMPRRRFKPEFPLVRNLVDYGRHHRLLPLVVERLRNIVLDPESEALITSIRAELVTKALQLAAELKRIRARLWEASIPTLPFKGPVLAERLWGDVALRSMGDLDVIVKPADVIRAHQVMLDMGYVPKVEVLPQQERPFVRYEHDRAYVSQVDGNVVELHWRLFDRYIAFELTDEELWGGLDGSGGGEILPEVEMVILALHGAKHSWSSAGWVVDIAAMVLRDELDERILFQLARATGTRRALRLAHALAHSYAAVPLTDRMKKEIGEDPTVGELCRETIEGPLSRERSETDLADNPVYYLRTRERVKDRLLYKWYWTMTPNIADQNAFKVPRRLSWLNYPVRILRLLHKGWSRRS